MVCSDVNMSDIQELPHIYIKIIIQSLFYIHGLGEHPEQAHAHGHNVWLKLRWQECNIEAILLARIN